MDKQSRVPPLVLVDTSSLSREEWLRYRRKGIGGSDAAAIMRISPFRTARDIYFDKLGVVSADNAEDVYKRQPICRRRSGRKIPAS